MEVLPLSCHIGTPALQVTETAARMAIHGDQFSRRFRTLLPRHQGQLPLTPLFAPEHHVQR